MSLLPEDKLIWSPVVANCRMNRERNAIGINSYAQDLGINPIALLEALLQEKKEVAWLDVCCGMGKALRQAALHFAKAGLEDRVSLLGVDLIGDFATSNNTSPSLAFETASVVDWLPAGQYDLITCVHGLHYVGDKLKALENLLPALRPQGIFIANFDIASIHVSGVAEKGFLSALLKKKGLVYNSKKKLLQREGPASPHFGLTYLGADDTVGPNYTGQAAVTSHYAV
jgi:SAM-dependent methyltransferase